MHTHTYIIPRVHNIMYSRLYILYFVVPINVNGRAVSQIVGDPLSLRCDVSIARGITSNMDIVWLTGGNVIANYNDSEIMTESKFAYTLYYNGSEKLTLNDNNTVYQCQVLINNMSFIDNLTLNVTEHGESNSTCIPAIASYIHALIFIC